jgi:F0F1-type ATP synthase assembly protein I
MGYSARMPQPAKRLGGVLRGVNSARVQRDERVGWRMVGVGMQVSSEAIAGALLGWLVDWWMGNQRHWGLLIGGTLGIVVALVTLIRTAWKLNQEMDRTDAQDRADDQAERRGDMRHGNNQDAP